MHLQINLSNNLIKSWKPTMSDAPPDTDPLLCWRLDQISFGRKRANYICVNENTLFSFVMTDLAGKKPVEIQQCFLNELFYRLQDLHFPQRALDQCRNLPVLFGKTDSRKIIGCVTDMKKGYQFHIDYNDSHEEMEYRLNERPYLSMNIHAPRMAFMALRVRFSEEDPKFIRLAVPSDFIYAVRRNFDPWPAAIYNYDTDNAENGMVEAHLSSAELSELGARLMAGPDRGLDMQAGDADYLRFLYEEVVRVMGL